MGYGLTAKPFQRDAVVLLLLLAAVTALVTTRMSRRPDAVFNEAYLFGDESYGLLVAQDLLAGRMLYRDIWYHYGPAPAYLHAGFSRCFDNTPSSYAILTVIISLGHVVLLFLLLRRVVSLQTTAVILAFALVPSFFPFLALGGGYTSSIYIPLERCLLVAVALCWRPPGQRTMAQAAALGLLLGSWQWVKFGGALLAGAAILVADLLSFGLEGWRSTPARAWLRLLAVTLATFGVLQLALAVSAFLVLPTDAAWDVVWPFYHVEAYERIGLSRWPRWHSLRFFLAQQLTLVTCGLLAIGGLAATAGHRPGVGPRGVGERRPGPADLCVFILAVFFMLGALGYFRHEHLFMQYAWALAAPAAWCFERLGRGLKVVLLCLWLPGVAVMARHVVWSRPDPLRVRVGLPSGQALWLRQPLAEFLPRLFKALSVVAPASENGAVLFLPMGAGFHYAFGIPHASRYVWFIPGFVRPYDSKSIAGTADQLKAVVLFDMRDIGGQDAPEPLERVVGQAAYSALMGRLEQPVLIGVGSSVFRVRSDAPPGQE